MLSYSTTLLGVTATLPAQWTERTLRRDCFGTAVPQQQHPSITEVLNEHGGGQDSLEMSLGGCVPFDVLRFRPLNCQAKTVTVKEMVTLSKREPRAPHNTLDDGLQRRVPELLQSTYAGCNTHHFTERLAERDGIAASPDKVGVRLILLPAGLWSRPDSYLLRRTNQKPSKMTPITSRTQRNGPAMKPTSQPSSHKTRMIRAMSQRKPSMLTSFCLSALLT